METIIYENLKDFKENYFVDFSIQNEYNLLQYLSMLKKKYNNHIDECRALHDKDDTTVFKILGIIDDLDDLLPYQSYYILKNDLLDEFNPMQYSYDDFIECPEISNECIDLGKHSPKETEILHEKIKTLFTLKKQWSIKEDEFYRKTDTYYEIVKYITDQIEIEKNILLRSQNDNFSKQTGKHKNIDIDIQDIFNSIRYYDVGYFERTKILKDVTENYHIDLLTSLLKDLEFYLFIEKETKEAEFTSDEVMQAIHELQAKNLPIPRINIDPKYLFLTRSPKEEIKTNVEIKAQVGDKVITEAGDEAQPENKEKDIVCPDLEKLLFPYEFFPLYEFQRMIVQKIKEVSPNETFENEIDISEFKTSKTKSIALLHHTGILQFLRNKYPCITDNQLAGFFELITKEPIYRIGVNPCIAVFTAHKPHDFDTRCKFINYEDDGYIISKHIGLTKTVRNEERKQLLLDCWFDKKDTESKFMVKTTIEPDDEWLHSFYYFNDEIPKEEDFEKTIADYLTFEFNMIMQGREYLFENE